MTFKLKPTNDIVFKKLFGDEKNIPILQSFVQDMLGFNINIIRINNPYHFEDFINKDSEKLDYTEVDILAETEKGQLVTIEMQLNNHKHFLERSLFYACKGYVKDYANQEKMTTEYKFSSIRDTYSINIINFDLFGSNFPSLLNFDFKERHSNFPLANVGMQTITLTYLSLTNKNPNNCRVSEWQNFFKGEPLQTASPDYIHAAKDLLNKIHLDKEEQRMAEILSKRQMIRQAEMEYATEQGLEQGLEQGREEERSNNIKKLFDNGLSLEQISEFLEIPLDQVRTIVK
ncbi:Rpn family recombination-promoting nuclease/putative transposase [Hutsoniella sourekii]|uniref:Rpn family recombination-promoting nuclease/putative transposase n=1 Tax=Hutsoniella sourekii TaxID=87650 RepID=UPI0004B1963A|nr:Rpn family recombination-promoting nuclease/putative transposase [Hutsoniella sourekii]